MKPTNQNLKLINKQNVKLHKTKIISIKQSIQEEISKMIEILKENEHARLLYE